MSFPKTPQQPDFADLVTSLANSGQQTKNNALYQTIFLLLQRITKSRDLLVDDIKKLQDTFVKVLNVTFLTQDDETISFPNSRKLLESLGIAFDDSLSGERTLRLTHYWNVLTDGAATPALVTASGDAIACEVPVDNIAPFFPMGI